MSLIRLHTLWLSATAASLIAVAAAAQGNAPAAQPAPAAATSAAPRLPAPKDAYVYIGWPLDGATVGTKFKIWFGTRNFGIAPAGVDKPNTGHHHLLIDVPLPPLDQPIPNDHNHLHFGLGQTEAEIELPPGKHTLQLLVGDANHVPHDPPVMSKRITIYVRGERPAPVTQ
jgi:hypothetical protein